MNPIISHLTQFQNIPSGYNPLAASVTRDPLVINNFSNASAGYNVVLPAINISNLSVYNINGIDNLVSSLKVGVNTSTILIGGSYSSTLVYSKITEINSQTIQIGLSTTTSLGTMSTQLANISLLNVSTASITKLNASHAFIENLDVNNTSIINMNSLNASISQLYASMSNIDTLNANYITCNNISAYNGRQCYAVWYTTTEDEKGYDIGHISLHTVQTSLIDNISSINANNGRFLCSYDGIYLCSVIVMPTTATETAIVYLKQNNTYIGPIIYGNTGSQKATLCGSLSLYCNTGDLLSFYNRGTPISVGNSSTLVPFSTNDPSTSQMCSITLL
jgi:hypothetical protein